MDWTLEVVILPVSDIDRAIVHDVLIPELLRQNQMEKWSASWADKRKRLEPLLIGLAESMKVSLSRLLAQTGPWIGARMVSASGRTLEAEIGGVVRQLRLSTPQLDEEALTKLLRPFLDPEPLPEVGDEYVQRS